MKLKNKVALITGSSRGIGKSIALLFAKEGAKIIVNFLGSGKEANETVTEIEKIGSQAIAIKCDVSNENQVKKMIKTSIDKFGKIDILVNNAGKLLRPGESKTTSENWDQTININLKGVWLVTREVFPYLQKNEGSSILNIASYVGILSSQYVLPYGAAKAGVINITKAYAKELAPKIRVNSISPGNIDTEMTRGAGEDFIQRIVNNTPLKRLGKTNEIAKSALFLVSDDASFITGDC